MQGADRYIVWPLTPQQALPHHEVRKRLDADAARKSDERRNHNVRLLLTEFDVGGSRAQLELQAKLFNKYYSACGCVARVFSQGLCVSSGPLAVVCPGDSPASVPQVPASDDDL